MTLNCQNALCRRKDAYFGARCTNSNELPIIMLHRHAITLFCKSVILGMLAASLWSRCRDRCSAQYWGGNGTVSTLGNRCIHRVLDAWFLSKERINHLRITSLHRILSNRSYRTQSDCVSRQVLQHHSDSQTGNRSISCPAIWIGRRLRLSRCSASSQR